MKKIIVRTAVAVFVCLSSCCEEGNIFPASDAWITFIDRSLRSSVFKSPYSFPKDSLKVFNSKGVKQNFRFTGPDNTILLFDLYNDQTDQIAMTQEVCKEYVFQLLYSEVDTVRICYKVENEECGVTLFAYINVYYKKDSLSYINAEGILQKNKFA